MHETTWPSLRNPIFESRPRKESGKGQVVGRWQGRVYIWGSSTDLRWCRGHYRVAGFETVLSRNQRLFNFLADGANPTTTRNANGQLPGSSDGGEAGSFRQGGHKWRMNCLVLPRNGHREAFSNSWTSGFPHFSQSCYGKFAVSSNFFLFPFVWVP